MTSPIPSNLDGLIGLSRRHGVDIKPTLLRVLTDLYIQKPTHSSDEEKQYATLALRLLEVVDPATRAVVRRKLAAYGAAPEPVMRRLFGDDVAMPGTTPARAASPAGAADPAPRSPMPPPSATERTAVAAQLTAAFFAAESPERRMIIAGLDTAGAARLPSPRARDLDATVRRLEEAALGGRPGDFLRELERALGVPRAIAQRIVNDPAGEPIIVAAKALGMPLAVLQRVILFVNPAVGHSVRRVYDLSALYDEIGTPAAHALVALWRDSEPVPSQAVPPASRAGSNARRVREAAPDRRDRPTAIDVDEDLFLDRPQRSA